MTYLNQLDLQDRIYLIVEKISELGNQYSDDLRLGKSCALKHKQQLLFLEGVLEMLKCYQPIGKINITKYSIGSIIVGNNTDTIGVFDIYINNEFIEEFSINSPNTPSLVNSLVQGINNSDKNYNAYSVDNIVYIYSTISGDYLPLEVRLVSGKILVGTWEGLYGTKTSISEADNCLTEEKIQSLLDFISKEYNICFPPIGTTFN